MAFWILDEWDDGPLDYPMLGFVAEPGDVLEASAAPDPRWSSTGSGPETVTRYTVGGDPSYVEPGDGYVLTWSDVDNAYVPTARPIFLAADADPVMADLLADADSETYGAAAEAFTPDPKASLAGGTARWYGDSWSAGYGLGAGNSYIQKAATEYGMTTFDNLAVSGSAAQSIGTLMVWGGSAFEWTEGCADLLVLNAGLNDARYNDLSLAANYKWLKSLVNSLRVGVAVALGKERVPWNDYSRWTYTAGWLGGAYLYSTDGAQLGYTLSRGASATFDFEGDEVTVICGGYYTETTAVADFYIDDEHIRSVRFVDDTVIYPGSGTTVGYRAERFTGLAPGPHTVKIVKADDTTAAVYLDSAFERSDSPPLVLINKEPTLPADVYAMYDPYDNGNDDSIKAMQKAVDDVAAEFGVRLCNLPVLTPVTDFQADLIHPDASGRDILQAAVVEALAPPILTDRVGSLAATTRVHRVVAAPRRTVVSRYKAVLLAPVHVPEGAVGYRVRALGGGGGGGSGRRGAAGTVRCGGGGSSGAGFCDVYGSTYGLPRVIYVTAGTGGAGGAAITADDTNGNDGVSGIPSYVVTDSALPADEGIYLAYASGGTRGRGGTNATGLQGAAVASLAGLSGIGAAASTTGGVGVTTTANGYNGVGQGGGSGGGLTTGNAQSAGGNGWWSGFFHTVTLAAPAGGTAGGGNGAAGSPASSLQGRFMAEASGAGGGSNASGAGGAGGKGGRGSGGGGGGASVNGSASGKGGDGGDGFVEITWYF